MDIKQEPIDQVGWLDEIPIAFGVTRVLDVSLNNGGLGGITLTEMPVDEPWVKDYDAVHDEGPSRWADQFNVSNWGLLTAHDANRLIGGAVLLATRREWTCWKVAPTWQSCGTSE